MKGHLGPPSSYGAAPIPVEVRWAINRELSKPGVTAEKLRVRLVPPVGKSTFWRAMRGEKVSKPPLPRL